MKLNLAKLAEIKKAVVGALGTAVALAAYVIASANIHGTALTVAEWVVGVGAVLGVGKGVHAATNKSPTG